MSLCHGNAIAVTEFQLLFREFGSITSLLKCLASYNFTRSHNGENFDYAAYIRLCVRLSLSSPLPLTPSSVPYPSLPLTSREAFALLQTFGLRMHSPCERLPGRHSDRPLEYISSVP